jgi:hypothetical protein
LVGVSSGVISFDRGRLAPLAQAILERLHRAQSGRLLRPVVLKEEWHERNGGHPVELAHGAHLRAALEWLCRAQDVTVEGGVSRGYSLVWNPELVRSGWQPEHPETTGQVIVTLYEASRHLERADLAARGGKAARWLLEVQRQVGVLRGRAPAEPISPSVFHTGRVVQGWLAAFRHTGNGVFASAARSGARHLAAVLEEGPRRNGRDLGDASSAIFKARAGWALAEAGEQLQAPEFSAAAAQALREVAQAQHEDAWIPVSGADFVRGVCLHSLAHAIRGLLEGGYLLKDEDLLERAARLGAAVAALASSDGRIPGRIAQGWRPAASWSCPSGVAQMAGVWLRLFEIMGERVWLQRVSPVLRFLKSSQNRGSWSPGLRGGIKGSVPFGGSYGRYQTLNWATAAFVDAIMLHKKVLNGAAASAGVAVLK